MNTNINGIRKMVENADLRAFGYRVQPTTVKTKEGLFVWFKDNADSDGQSVPKIEVAEEKFATEALAWANARQDAENRGLLESRKVVEEAKDVDIHEVIDLDPEYAAKFKKPWIAVEEDGTVHEFSDEDSACTFQREYRVRNGLDAMTGELARKASRAETKAKKAKPKAASPGM